MNKTDRLLAILLELQRAKQIRAEDLAAIFETSKRTIYRDIDALAESGVPIVAVTGQGFSLAEGYFLPPLAFSVDEATLLLLGADFMAGNFDAQYQRAARSASAKIEAVLPPRVRDEARYLQGSLRFVSTGADSGALHDLLLQLRRAIVEKRAVRFRYGARFSKDKLEAREVDPYALANVDNVWYLVAHDRTRRARRTFRLSRIAALSFTAQNFDRPAGFVVSEDDRPDERDVTVRAVFDLSVAEWVRESPNFFTVDMRDAADGLHVTLRARAETDVLHWLLSWGSRARVLEPASLRERIAAEARKMLEISC